MKINLKTAMIFDAICACKLGREKVADVAFHMAKNILAIGT